MSTNCCVCLDTTYITTLNEKDNFNESLLSKILILVPEVKWSGELKICLACLEELNSAYDFRKKCLVNSNDPRSLETYAEPRKRKIKQKPQDNFCKTQPIVPVQHVQNKGVPFIQLQIDPLAQQNVKTEEITIEDTILSEVNEEEPPQPEIISLQIVPDGEETSQMEQFFDASTQDGNDIRYMYECEVCHAIFERKQPLIDHCVQSHQMDQLEIRPFACKVCPKKFLSLCNLKNHVLTHTEIRSYICDICNKGFKRAYDLKHHKDTLHNTMRYGCKACKKFFTTRSNLKKHIVSQHMDASKFNHFCNVCGKRFVQGKDQVIHVFRYHGKDIDELKCYDCEIRFNTKQELVNHMRTHKDIWHRHQCQHCENKYKNPAGLRKHLRKVHFINP